MSFNISRRRFLQTASSAFAFAALVVAGWLTQRGGHDLTLCARRAGGELTVEVAGGQVALVWNDRLPADPLASTYQKVRVRGAIDYPLAGIAVALSMADGAIASRWSSTVAESPRAIGPVRAAGRPTMATKPERMPGTLEACRSLDLVRPPARSFSVMQSLS